MENAALSFMVTVHLTPEVSNTKTEKALSNGSLFCLIQDKRCKSKRDNMLYIPLCSRQALKSDIVAKRKE